MSQAAVSYQMKVLEERLGSPLFVRHARGMALTELGKRIAPQVSSAFRAMEESFASVKGEADTILSITAPRTFATNWLAGRLGDFNASQPDLSVRLDVTDTIVDLTASSFDVAIRGVSVPDPGLVSQFLLRMPITPLVSPAFLAAYPLAVPEDLMRVRRLSPEDPWWDTWFESLPGAMVTRGSAPSIRFESQVLDGHAAIAGHGVAVLSPPMFTPAIESGLLVQPFEHVAYEKNGFWLVYLESKRTLPKVRAFREWLVARVRETVGENAAWLALP